MTMDVIRASFEEARRRWAAMFERARERPFSCLMADPTPPSPDGRVLYGTSGAASPYGILMNRRWLLTGIDGYRCLRSAIRAIANSAVGASSRLLSW